MQTISTDSLDSVTGGTGSTIPGGSPTAGATSTPTIGSSTPGTCNGSPLLGALSSLNNSIKGLNNNSNDGFNATDMLMFGMAMAFSRPAEPSYYVVDGGGYGGFGGFGGGCGGRGGFGGGGRGGRRW